MLKRDFLRAGIGLAASLGGLGIGAALGQGAPPAGAGAAGRGGRGAPPTPVVKAKTTVLWQVPKGAKGTGAPNALAWDTDNRGIWYGEEEGPLGDRKNNEAVLVDLNGKELKRIKTSASNVSGMAEGGGYIWMGSSGGSSFYRVNIATGEEKGIVTALSPPDSPSHATHGMAWDDDNKKLWVADPQMGVLTRMDPVTLLADRIIKLDMTHFSRLHGTAYYQGALYQVGWIENVPGVPTTSYTSGHGGIIKYDLNTGRPSLYIDFVPNSIDPHAVAIDRSGKMYVCDSGFHPGIPDRTPPYTGDIGTVTLL